MNDNAERYFIQFLFCRNWELLKAENRRLYDVMFGIYRELYDEGKRNHLDVMDINKAFLAIFGIEK